MLATRDSAVASSVDNPVVVRDEAGVWRYDGTEIAAVGARDVTLAEVVNPRALARAGEEPDAIILSLSEIIADARLNWILQEGTKLDGGDEPLFLLSLELWQERSALPVKAWLPETDASGVDRCLAIAERNWRFARKALDDAGLDRTRLVLLASRMGRSRRDVSETLGLSSGRVQQLNDDPPLELAAEVDRFLRDASDVAVSLEARERSSSHPVTRRGLGADRSDEVVADMISLGLLEEMPDGLRVTEAGRSLASLEPQHSTSQRAKPNARLARKRAADAHQ
jgi:hypothetical protein